MLALSIRQPYAELILCGIKTIEFRSRPTRRIGERFYIYAAKAKAKLPVWSDDLAVPGTNTAKPPAWMIELARQVKLIPPDQELPTGVIVGSAVIERCEEVEGSGFSGQGSGIEGKRPSPLPLSQSTGRGSLLTPDSCLLTPVFRWHLVDVQRAKRLRKPTGHAQPVWFRPF